MIYSYHYKQRNIACIKMLLKDCTYAGAIIVSPLNVVLLFLYSWIAACSTNFRSGMVICLLGGFDRASKTCVEREKK